MPVSRKRRKARARTLRHVLAGGIAVLVAQDEVHNGCRVVEAVGVVVAAGLDDKFYRAAQLGVGVGDGLHVCGEGNGAVGVAAYGHYGYARLSQPRQGLQRHAGERRVGLFVPDTPFREQSGPQVLLPPARPAQHVAYGRVDVDAGHLVRVARGPVPDEQSPAAEALERHVRREAVVAAHRPVEVVRQPDGARAAVQVGEVVIHHVESAFEQRLVHRGESAEEGRPPNPRTARRCLARHDHRGLAPGVYEVVARIAFPFGASPREGLPGGVVGRLAARQRLVDQRSHAGRSFFVGMDAVRETAGVGLHGRMEVDDVCAQPPGHAAHGGHHLVGNDRAVYTARSEKAGYGQAEVDARQAFGPAERLDNLGEIAFKVGVEFPVPRLAVVCPQLDDENVGPVVHCVDQHPFAQVGIVATPQGRAARVAEVAHVVALSQQLAEHTGVTVLVLVSRADALRDTVAHTGHADRFVGPHRPCRARQQQGEENCKLPHRGSL